MTVKYCRQTVCIAFLIFTFALTAGATTITIVNTNAPGQGFNDATPAVPMSAPGNPGATLGAQRLFVFQQAANQWATLLNSSVEIRVQAAMDPLTCGGMSATLGSAGPITAISNFPGAPRVNIAYAIAEANALAGADLISSGLNSDDIDAHFNVDMDNGSCLTGVAGWYYGTDSTMVPNNRVPLLPVVFHELGHGFGFISLVSTTNGAYFTSRPPIWASYLFDESAGLLWSEMSNAQRLTSTTNDPNLVWTGPRTNKQSTKYLRVLSKLIVNSPIGIVGSYDVQPASFGAAVPSTGITGTIVLAQDSGGPSMTDACEALSNGAAVSGHIALVDRGICTYAVKVKNAQNAGAIAVLVANTSASGFPGMQDTDPTVTISSYGITLAVGNSIKANLPAPGVNATLGYASDLAGTNQGCVRMYAPTPVNSGSSVSHFHSEAYPSLLMEPSLNTSIFNRVDLTLPLFQDIDWSTNPENILFIDGLDNNPCQHVQP